MRLSPGPDDPTVVADTGGRPLGLHIARDGRVLICDSHRGLLALDPDSGTLDVLAESVAGKRLKFSSNVTETADGTIYFTESTSDFHFEHFTAPIVEARGRGGLFRLGTDGTVSTLVDGLYFANGLTPTVDCSALVFAETQARRLSKYWLSGPQAGSVTPLAVHLPGMPDNLSTGADGRIWTAMVSEANAALEWMFPRPRSFASWCGDCPSGCNRRSSRRSGRSRSIRTAVRPSPACAPSIRSSAPSPVWSRRPASCG